MREHVGSIGIGVAVDGAVAGIPRLDGSTLPIDGTGRNAPASLAALQRITDATIAHLEIDALVAEVLERTASVLEADLAALFLVRSNGTGLVLRASGGPLGSDLTPGLAVELGDGFVGRIGATREAFALTEADSFRMDGLRTSVRSVAGVPLVALGVLVGVLQVAYVDREEIRPEQFAVLQAAGDRVAVAISNATRFERERRERAQFDNLIESLTDAIVIVDERGRIVRVNAAAVDLFGYSREELLALDVEALVPRDVRAGHRALREGMPVGPRSRAMAAALEVRARRKDGSILPVEISLSSVETDEGLRSTAVVTDISERRRLEGLVRHQQKMEAVGRFAGGIAHDFNNILTSVIGFAELAALEPSSPRQAELLAELRSASWSAADLTRQLLAFSAQSEIDRRTMNLNSLVREHEAALSALVPDRIEVVLRLDPDLPPVEVDAVRMRQVLTNLVVNACDAMEGGGSLTIETRVCDLPEAWEGEAAHGRIVQLRVVDTGSGMDELTRERAFEPFYSTKGENGTGLGLASVHGSIRSFGGQVALETAPGVGTAVVIHLPLVVGRSTTGAVVQPAHPPVEPEQAETSTGGAKLLLVEDEPQVRELTKLMLEGIGYAVATAATPAEALARDDIATFDAVMSDMVMPGLSGDALVRELRMRKRTLRALYTSGYTEQSMHEEGTLEPGDRFLPKPFTLAELGEAIAAVLAAPAAS